MNPQEQIFWKQIESFHIGEAKARFSFTDRLARDNGWTKSYAQRVVEEYKKFLFLCCVTDQGVTPSDPVDQAWHLHLTYTRSYWVDLCKNTLGKEIHHNPTKGGPEEAEKFEAFYAHTSLIYKEKFGQEPPNDIWQNNHERFTDIDFQRVNRRQVWIIQKPSYRLKSFFLLLGISAFGSFFIQASFDVSSYLFIGFLVALGIVAFRRRGGGGDRSGGSSTGCGADSGAGTHHGDHGCSSGCSGCSASGCSGCGGGGD